jgi:multidrug resistance efflux pump
MLGIAGGIGYWIYNNYNYYTTDDAQVNGQVLTISSPQAGQLTAYSVKLGDTVTAGQTVGTITVQAPTGQQTVNITSPIAGTVVQSSVIQGQSVVPGLSLLEVADLSNLNIIAYVDENAISNVKLNQAVDIHIDAYGGTTYSGHVENIVQTAASQFSLLPTTDVSSGNFTKVGQRIPVVVTLDNNTNDIVPGMSAEVTIHLH